ncbi:Glutathione S-transferase, N-terminal domain [Seminavis robusta]|uniref:Glutathione S-transferase, N-terminal domain n=1 Tax=Seminavis robusta TaxID=568900 RepID=A0A9N8DWU4_9STRA|nr:Glutathione S-transferase, N-terminal domain [Seminavis robusta]|eukprot:Sro306_g113110.1 Glutathione S-transferase, N-terminal domain (232) ;mRNA; f:66392-67087
MAIETAPITFKYLALPNGLGGRGGAQRFFLLANNIPFQEDLVDLSEWGATEKARVVSSNENPCGTLPILYTHDNNKDDKNVHLIQHIAASRYLAHLHGITKDNTAYEEYVQDLVADEYQGFRNAWVNTAFSGTDEEKAKYQKDDAPKFLTIFDALYAKYKTHETFLSVSKSNNNNTPLWADAALFGLLRDNIITGLIAAEDLEKSNPNLWAMYVAFGKIPAVKAWIDGKTA